VCAEKRTQQTTHIGEPVVKTEETITVIDPRHPLVGRTFPLINIANMPRKGPCCIVRYLGSLERFIPLSATDRSSDPIQISSSSVNLASVRQLLQKYEQLMSQLAEDREDGNSDQDSLCTCKGKPSKTISGTDTDGARADLGYVDPGTTAECVSTDGEHLLSSGTGEQRSAGGER
jgi:hypothetical protein